MTRKEFENKIKEILYNDCWIGFHYFAYDDLRNDTLVMFEPIRISFEMLDKINKLTNSENISIELEIDYEGNRSFEMRISNFYVNE